MAEISNEQLVEMVNSAVKEAMTPINEQFNRIRGMEQQPQTEKEISQGDVSDAVKQYIAAKQTDDFSGKNVESINKRHYSMPQGEAQTDLKATMDSLLTGKTI